MTAKERNANHTSWRHPSKNLDHHPRFGHRRSYRADALTAAKVLTVDPKTGASSVFMTVTGHNPGLDGLTFEASGSVYVTDAHQGIIWKIGRGGGEATAIAIETV